MSRSEFIAGMASLMSLAAFAIDAMLPAMTPIAAELGVVPASDVQSIIPALFLGMGLGLMVFGPLSDARGRKLALLIGGATFLVGVVVSWVSTSFGAMLAGRILQGFGAASCRVVTLAMIRDKFAGREMAQVMSLIMIVFILVPALAPSVGQLVLSAAGWRAIFGVLFAFAAASLAWLAIRQPDTLAMEDRIPFSPRSLLAGSRETLRHPTARGYMLASGLVFGAFVGYLSSSQPILQDLYGLGDWFALAFGGLALAIGVASLVNSRLVMRLGMARSCKTALTVMVATAAIQLVVTLLTDGRPPLAVLLVYLVITFFGFGILFGNFNAMAVEPLGHVAGVATSVIASVQTLFSVLLGGGIGALYDGTVLPLVAGFFVLSAVSLVLTVRTSRNVGA